MRLHYPIMMFAVLPMMAQTQLFTFGVKGGMPAETPLGQTDSRMPFVIGPTVNIRIFSRLSLETGVMFSTAWGKAWTTVCFSIRRMR